MNDNKVKIFEYLDTLVKMCRSKGNGASLAVEEDEIVNKINEYDLEIEEINNLISNECYDASAEMADRNIEIITKKIIQQLKSKLKQKNKELNDLKVREEDYSYQVQILKNNKQSHNNYIKSLKTRITNTDNGDVLEKYQLSLTTTEEKLKKIDKELENKNLEYLLLQKNIEEVTGNITTLEANLKIKESLLKETQANLKDKSSYLDQSKVDKQRDKIEEIEKKKKKLSERILEIKNNTQYLVYQIKEAINANKDKKEYVNSIVKLVNQANRVPYMNQDANKLLEETLLKATQARDSFALEIDQKNYSLFETLNPGKIRIDYLTLKIEKWNEEVEELKEKIFVIDNDRKFNYQDKFEQLNDLLDTMKKELSEFEKALNDTDDISLSSQADLKMSIEEKKKEIFDTENILSLFRKDESTDIYYANDLYTHNIKELETNIESAELEIKQIKDKMLARKSGIIDITSQNRDKEKLKELAVKVIDIKHRRQFAEKPIEIAEELEQLLEIEIIAYITSEEEQEVLPEISVIVGDSSINLNEPEKEEEKELTPEDFDLQIASTRGVKVIEQIEYEPDNIEEDEVMDAIIVAEDEDIETIEENTKETEKENEDLIDDISNVEEDIVLSNEHIELPEELPEELSEDQNEKVDDIKLEPAVITDDTVKLSTVSVGNTEELAIGEIFKENSSQDAEISDNIVLDNNLSEELDQYINNLDTPNS